MEKKFDFLDIIISLSGGSGSGSGGGSSSRGVSDIHVQIWCSLLDF